MSATLAATAALSPETLVWFTHKDVQCVGVFQRVAKARVNNVISIFGIVEHDGKLLKGPLDKFRPQTAEPVAPAHKVIWNLSNYRRLKRVAPDAQEPYTAMVLLNGIAVLRIVNRGEGGGVECEDMPNVPTNVKRAFYEMTKAFNGGNTLGADEAWVDYTQYHKATKSPEEYHAQRAEYLETLLGGNIFPTTEIDIAVVPNQPRRYTVVGPDGSKESVILTINEKREWRELGYKVIYESLA